MSLYLVRKQSGSLAFTLKNNWSPAGIQVAEAAVLCAVNLEMANESVRAASERIQEILLNAREIIPEFSVTMELIDATLGTQRLEGILRGEFLRSLFQAFEVDHFRVKLEIGLVLPTGWRKTLVLQEVSFLNNNTEVVQANVAFRFTHDLDPCWVPTPDFQYNYELSAELLLHEDKSIGSPMPQSLTEMNRKILEEAVNVDFELVLKDGTAIPCHQLFLQSCSDAFAKMIQRGAQEVPPQHVIRLGGPATKAGVSALLKYIYYRDLMDPMGSPQIAFELLVLAHCYQISNLERVMKELLLQKKEEWWRQDFKAEVAANLFMAGSDWGEPYEQLVERAIQILQLKYSRSKDT